MIQKLAKCPRDVGMAVLLLAGAALGLWLVLRGMDAPWGGNPGRLLFGKGQVPDAFGERLGAVLQVFFDSSAPVRERFKPDDWIRLGSWVGVAFGMVVCLLAALGAPWWVRWCRAPAGVCERADVVRSGWRAPRWSVAVLVAGVAIAAAIRLPTLGGPLLWDEQDNHRHNFHGYLEMSAPDAAPKWREATWKHALWHNVRGNNPALYSGCAWACNEVWRALTGAPRERTSVVATRLPSAVCGLLSIVTLWWMLNAVGLGRIAPWAALLAAAHPLAAEFTRQARAYGMTLCLVPVLLGAGWRMVRHLRRRDTAMFGLAQLGILFSFAGAFYAIVTVNLVLGGMLAWQWWRREPDGRCRVARWAVVNAATVAVLFVLLAAALPQQVTFMNNSFQAGVMPPFWYVVSYNLFATGMHFGFDRGEFFAPIGPWPSAWAWLFGDYWRAWPVALLAMVVAPVVVVLGMVRIWRAGDRVFFLLAVALLAGGALCIAHHALVTKLYIYAWYAIYTLPVLLVAVAAGLAGSGLRSSTDDRPSRRNMLVGGGAVVVASLWLLGISHPAVRPKGWQTESVHIMPRPVKVGFETAAPGCLARQTYQRGSSYWVYYEDGFHVLLKGSVGNDEVWRQLLDRPRDHHGVFP